MIGTAAALLGSAAIGGGTSLLGGLFGSSAANKAGQLQYQMSKEQAQKLMDLLNQYNPEIGRQASIAQNQVLEAGQLGSDRATGAAQTANDYLWPYRGIGADAATSLAQYMAPGGALNQVPSAANPTAADILAQDPGYQFRIDQASKALQASAAAKGGALGGGAMQSLQNLIQNTASGEYGAAFGRFEQLKSDRDRELNDLFTRLNTITGLGYNASGAAGSNLINAAQFGSNLQYEAAKNAGVFGTSGAEQQAANALATGRNIADLMTGGAAAQAAGGVGAANALSGALGGVGNAAINYANQRNLADLFSNPAIIRNTVPRTTGTDWRTPYVLG